MTTHGSVLPEVALLLMLPGVVPRKCLYTGKVSFSACLAENPGALKITGFYARKRA